MLQAMMIMVMTNEYSFPSTIAKSNRETSSSQEEKVERERWRGGRGRVTI